MPNIVLSFTLELLLCCVIGIIFCSHNFSLQRDIPPFPPPHFLQMRKLLIIEVQFKIMKILNDLCNGETMIYGSV